MDFFFKQHNQAKIIEQSILFILASEYDEILVFLILDIHVRNNRSFVSMSR